MNIFESKWCKLLEEVLLSHKKHVKDKKKKKKKDWDKEYWND